MLKWLVILTAVVSLRVQGLEPVPQPGEGEQHSLSGQGLETGPQPGEGEQHSPSGQGLETGPQPGEGQQHPERKQVRRNLPYYPFAPFFTPYQQVIEVHHVVMLQPPNCQAVGQLPPYGPSPPFQPQTPGAQIPPQQPTATESPDLLNRLNPPKPTPLPKRPSRCVWAIVSCCSPDSTAIRYSCFELLGCPGSFWGVNPCEKKIVEAAANTALMYYKNEATSQPEGNSV